MKENKKYVKWVIIIAFIFLFLMITVILINNNKLFNKKDKEYAWKIKEIVVNREDYYATYDLVGQVGTIPKWNERNITQQFSLINYNGEKYDVRNTTIKEKRIKEKIKNVTLIGEDSYTNTIYSHNAELFTLKDFPSECVIAVKYEGTNDYYVSINSYYKPKTLGDFIEDLNLKKIVSFGTIYYDYFDTDEQGNKNYEKIEFPDVNDNVIWEMLFDDISVENVHKDSIFHETIMGISVDIPLFGYENISVSVSEDGYLTTNIFETGKTFYIGEEKVQKFVDYIIENYDGYKTVYIDENGEILSEDMFDEEEEDKKEKDTIMMYDVLKNEVLEYKPNTNNSEQSSINSIEPYDPSKN